MLRDLRFANFNLSPKLLRVDGREMKIAPLSRQAANAAALGISHECRLADTLTELIRHHVGMQLTLESTRCHSPSTQNALIQIVGEHAANLKRPERSNRRSNLGLTDAQAGFDGTLQQNLVSDQLLQG